MIAIRGDVSLVLGAEGDKVRAPVFSALHLDLFITTKMYFKNFRYISSAIGSWKLFSYHFISHLAVSQVTLFLVCYSKPLPKSVSLTVRSYQLSAWLTGLQEKNTVSHTKQALCFIKYWRQPLKINENFQMHFVYPYPQHGIYNSACNDELAHWFLVKNNAQICKINLLLFLTFLWNQSPVFYNFLVQILKSLNKQKQMYWQLTLFLLKFT